MRHGDPTGLEPYLDHQRIHAAPFAEHCDNIASYWTGARTRGEHIAVTTTTNVHVDAINRAVQTHRHAVGQLGDGIDHGDRRLFVGDVIVTRRNQRFLHTSCGDSVRNRDYWTIGHIAPTGDVTVTRIDGHGTITLPHTYVTEHVQLGYAATEREHEQRRNAERQRRVDQLTEQLADLERDCAPHDHAIARTTRDLRDAEQRHRRTEHELANSRLLHRRTAGQAVADAADDITTARTCVTALATRATPSVQDLVMDKLLNP